MSTKSDDTAHDPGPPDAGEAPASPPPSPARKIILVVLALLLLIFAYSVIADRFTPYTSQATVDTLLVQVAPEVSGQVLEVGAKDNGPVKKGQLLFRIDPEPYEIALLAAQANLAAAIQGTDVSAADVEAARAQLSKNRVDLAASQKLGKIVTDLVDENALAKTMGIRARADTAKTQADVSRAEADVKRAIANLGPRGTDNPKVRQALAALSQAQLDMRNTTVIAPADGVVTNLRLSAGQYVNQGQPLLSFIGKGPRWITAAMRENQLGNLAPGDEVMVAFDLNPGKVFRGRVHSIDLGITQGNETPSGQLADVQTVQGWLREPQRFPVRIMLMPDNMEDAGLDVGRNGAQANVIVFADEDSILNPIGRLWIRLVSLLSYLR